MANLFVSYTSSDRDWAFWIAEELIALGHTPNVHEWDAEQGADIDAWMALPRYPADRVLFVVSDAYLATLVFERHAALWQAAAAQPGFVLLAVVQSCRLPTLGDHIRRCDLFDVPEVAARLRFRHFMQIPYDAAAEAWDVTAPAYAPTPPAEPPARPLAISGLPPSQQSARPDPLGLSDLLLMRTRSQTITEAPRYDPIPAIESSAPLLAAPPPAEPYPSMSPSVSGRPAAPRRGGGSGIVPWLVLSVVAGASAWLLRHQLSDALSSLTRPPHPRNSSLPITQTLAAAMSGRPSWDPDPKAPVDRVDFSAFSPHTACPGDEIIVQIFLHKLDDAAVAAARSLEADPAASRRGVATLAKDIRRGRRVDIMLEAPDLAVDETLQAVVWRGEPCACQYLVRVPPGSAERSYNLRARVLLGKVPVGSLRFAIAVSRSAVAQPAGAQLRGDAARHYRQAFLSYASPDRPEVLKRAQALQAAGISFFQDVLSMEPGERWERRLYREIDNCDLFLLFWSKNAAQSEWVLREAARALAAHSRSGDEAPEIIPVILEGPPVPTPIPPELQHLHFNDHLLYFMAAAAFDRRAPS